MLLPPQQPLSRKRQSTGFVLECSTASIGYYVATSLAWLIFVVTLPFSLFFCIKIVHEYKRMVVFRLGRLLNNAPLGPGVIIILPCIDAHTVVDLRTMSYDVPSQEMLTKDSVTVSVDAAVYFRTSDPVATIAAAVDSYLSTKQLAQTTLRNVLGTKSLSEIMSAREEIALQAQEILDPTAARWGIKVERVEVKDIRLPRELCRVLAREAEAAREADAKIVSATGELNASIALRRAADTISDSPIAIQLRYLQTLARISTTHNHTIVVPIPMELIQAAMKHMNKPKEDIEQSEPSESNVK
uniref:PHB domain-containing protein n=1 Tax=Panagrellus redivivus TaxID=6233 RepID=A0A7E4VJ04_PANRE